MGSPFNLDFYHFDSSEANALAQQCFRLVDTLNSIFSDYDSLSEVSRAAAQSGNLIPVSSELFAMIMRAHDAWKRSGRTFDVTLGSLTHLWRRARKEQRFPTDSEIKEAKRSSGLDNLVIYVQQKAITLLQQGMSFDFGGIVKGYAAQRVIDLLKTNGVTIALADAGGDMVMGDPPPGKKSWSIGINLPGQSNETWDRNLELKNCSVATSGDVYNFILHDGKKYSHIIDPRTGYGVTSQRNVTVIAKDGATADWLATACSILPIKQALALAKKENAALFIATLKNGKIAINKTENFDGYFENNEPAELR